MVSKKLFSAVVATAMILSIVGGSSVAFAQATTTSTSTITQTAVNTADLSTLVSFLKQANLTEVLNNTTAKYTVLAPTNAAFAKLNNTTIADLKNNTPALTQILLNPRHKRHSQLYEEWQCHDARRKLDLIHCQRHPGDVQQRRDYNASEH